MCILLGMCEGYEPMRDVKDMGSKLGYRSLEVADRSHEQTYRTVLGSG